MAITFCAVLLLLVLMTINQVSAFLQRNRCLKHTFCLKAHERPVNSFALVERQDPVHGNIHVGGLETFSRKLIGVIKCRSDEIKNTLRFSQAIVRVWNEIIRTAHKMTKSQQFLQDPWGIGPKNFCVNGKQYSYVHEDRILATISS